MDSSNSDESCSEVGAYTPLANRRTSATMTEDEERERRASIQEIMQDPELTPLERRRSIQALMDGRRRSSDGCRSMNGGVGSMSMMAAAAAAAAEFYASDDSDMAPSPLDEPDDDDSDMSSHSSGRETNTGSTNIVRRRSLPTFQRKGRSASLKAFASSAQAAVAAAAAAEFSDDPVDIQHAAERMEKSRPECDHYDRKCTIIAPCCGLAFGCRICHDDCPVLPPPTKSEKQSVGNGWSNDAHKTRPNREKRLSLPVAFQQEEAHHTIDRFAIAEVICRHCFTRQCSKT
jgi:hypothetical protein